MKLTYYLEQHCPNSKDSHTQPSPHEIKNIKISFMVQRNSFYSNAESLTGFIV